MAPRVPLHSSEVPEDASIPVDYAKKQEYPAQNTLTSFGSPTDGMFGGMNGGMYGGGMYGSSMYGGGMYGSSMYGGAGMYGGGGGMYGGGALTNLNQFLFGVQSVILSLGQAVQIVGMNASALQQLVQSASRMVDEAIQTFHAQQELLRDRDPANEERRKKLRMLRWAMVMGVSYAGYRVVRYLMSSRRRQAIAYPQQYYQGPRY